MEIFLSYSTPIRDDQRKVQATVEELIRKEAVTCRKVEQLPETQHPFFRVTDTIAQCDSMICLAFEKYQTIQQGKMCCRTSSWLEIEVAIALFLNLPVLILREPQIIDGPLIMEHGSPCKTITIPVQAKKCANMYKIGLGDFNTRICPQIVSWINRLSE